MYIHKAYLANVLGRPVFLEKYEFIRKKYFVINVTAACPDADDKTILYTFLNLASKETRD